MIAAPAGRPSIAKAWARALSLTAPIASRPARTLPVVIDELAERQGAAPALLSEDEWLTYADLARQARRYSGWARNEDLAKGDAVAVLMPNRPEYFAVWLGIARAGGIAALLNTELTGPALVHCINVARPKHLICDASLLDRIIAVYADLDPAPEIWIHGGDGRGPFPRITDHLDDDCAVAPRITIADRALYIYTSGTTGLPKAANVSHARVMQWTHWFAGLMDVRHEDRMYDCLPMYHSAGGVLAPGAVLVGGGSVVIGRKFSARRFWEEIVGWDCTLFQYIGELCRYLATSAPHPCESDHRLRLACGNGLRGDVWHLFKNRFRIPQVLEFYASTEGNVSLANLEGEAGAIGRVPAFLAHRSGTALIRQDDETGQPVRDAGGLCVRAAPDEVGEAIGRLHADPSNVGSWFEGYTDESASRSRILRDVFERGDAWCRTGDLMRRDARGYFYFVDRVGDTFRWKGENVATTEVAGAICRCPGIAEAAVYGVEVPGVEGRAGMAAVVSRGPFDPGAFRTHVVASLAHYARPLFVRVRDSLDTTPTLKFTTRALVREGYDPARITDALYVHDGECQQYVRLDTPTYHRIQSGHFRGLHHALA